MCLVGNHSSPVVLIGDELAEGLLPLLAPKALSHAACVSAAQKPKALHHVHIDPGNMVLMQPGSHFVFQTCWIHSIREVQEKYHASLVLEK